MNIARIAFCTVLWLTLLMAGTAQAQRNIDLELVTEPGVPLGTHQKWLAALKDVSVGSLKIRDGRPGDRAQVEDTGTKKSPSYVVTGIITKGGKLVTPGGSFGMDQKGELKAYLAKLATGKADEPQEKVLAFGLNEEQLVAVHESLAGKVTFETKGKSVGEVARKIVKELALTTDIDPEARRAVDAGEVVLDELSGLSYGTALAATLRPAGLVFAPIRVGKNEVRLRIADSQAVQEFWPIGWPPQQKITDTLPVMVKVLNVEINDVVLSEALTSIQGRVQAPFLYDHNGMARKEIDLKKKVSLKPGKNFYKSILDRLLAQAKLKCEVRVDEAGTPIVWISPMQ